MYYVKDDNFFSLNYKLHDMKIEILVVCRFKYYMELAMHQPFSVAVLAVDILDAISIAVSIHVL